MHFVICFLGLMAILASAAVIPRDDPNRLVTRLPDATTIDSDSVDPTTHATITITPSISFPTDLEYPVNELATVSSATAVSDSLNPILLPPTGFPLPWVGPHRCDYVWCNDGILQCLYFAGVTAYDVNLGPVPGETVASIGLCPSATVTSLATITDAGTSTSADADNSPTEPPEAAADPGLVVRDTGMANGVAVLPAAQADHHLGHASPLARRVVTVTITTTIDAVTDGPSPVVTAGPVAAADDDEVRCDNKYCEDGTQYCMYWAGITTYDPSRGVIPGEVRTALGSCP